MNESGTDHSGDEALVGLAVRLADGESVDWDTEEMRTPSLSTEIKGLRWLEGIATAARSDDSISNEDVTRDVSPRARPDALPGLTKGSRWGPLIIIERIGSGGGGDVYRAHDPELEREVALKLWRETPTQRTTGTEARRLAKVRHPAILAVHGSGRFDGYAGMWTDLVLGSNLEEVLSADGPLRIEEACRIGIALCDALEAMHRAGLVHRDLKTSNVMREPDGRVVLMDFGSVKELLRGVPEFSDRMRGTPLSMAPEVLRGDRIGPAADMYALGVLLYRLVTGAYPIEARTLAELIDLHRVGRFTSLRERRPDLPEPFLKVVDQALSEAPERRPPGADHFRRLLQRACDPPSARGLGGLWLRLRQYLEGRSR